MLAAVIPGKCVMVRMAVTLVVAHGKGVEVEVGVAVEVEVEVGVARPSQLAAYSPTRWLRR